MKSSLRSQSGAASLVVSLVLLFGMTLVAFFAGRSLLFEQKTSANQVRSTKAFEAADAGIEWAVGRLNDLRFAAFTGDSCTPGSGTVTYRDRYFDYPGYLNPVTSVRTGCTISSTGTLSCLCPAAGTNPALTGTDPTFTVVFDRAGIDNTAQPDSFRITAYGCTTAGSQCVPGAASASDGFAKVSIIVKGRPALRAVPAAAITTGGYARVCGGFDVSNSDTTSNGNLVNSGGVTQLGNLPGYSTDPVGASGGCGGNVGGSGGAAMTISSIPGTPLQNALVTSDTSLSSLASSSDNMFAAYFGTTPAQYQAGGAYVISGSNGSTNGNAFEAAYAQGIRDFWVSGPINLAISSNYGSPIPVRLAVTGDISLTGNGTIRGLLYGDSVSWGGGSGTANVIGAVVARGNFEITGTGSIVYDPDALRPTPDKGGKMVKLPGSWRDF